MALNPPDPSITNIQTIVALEQRAAEHRTPVDRVTDFITAAAASPAFVAVHGVLVLVWVAVNARASRPFDPYPYSLLTLVLSVEAIFLTGFVLMSQNRMTRQADRRAHLDLQVNLLAEQELTAILAMVTSLCGRDGIAAPANARVDQLKQETDIHKLAVAIDRELEDNGTAN